MLWDLQSIFEPQNGPQRIVQLEDELKVIKEDINGLKQVMNELKQDMNEVKQDIKELKQLVSEVLNFVKAVKPRSDASLPPPPGSLTGTSAPTPSMVQPSMSAGSSTLIGLSFQTETSTASNEPLTPGYQLRSGSGSGQSSSSPGLIIQSSTRKANH